MGQFGFVWGFIRVDFGRIEKTGQKDSRSNFVLTQKVDNRATSPEATRLSEGFPVPNKKVGKVPSFILC
jgi:hypothetical protein